ncbi:septum formation initiator family protein [uncultured Trichococcus sp.]|uniref:FtsB family cell division protein n=1 Tax=uncultured Trichococcus sp. TaxID=189665 RepID=UPI0029C96BE1|nr:septum formation initiator family protein [uncultured Trichococcus sp.]
MKAKTKKQPADNVTVMQNDFTKAQHSQKRIFQREKKAHMRRLSLIFFVGAALILPCLWKTVGNWLEIRNLDDAIAVAKTEKKQAEDENTQLAYEVKLLQDDEYIAKLARGKYYLSKDGEIIFSLPEDNQTKMAEKQENAADSDL